MSPPRARHQKASMTGAQFKALRQQMGLSVRDLARLLALTETTVYMIESPAQQQRINRQTEQMMRWLSDPRLRSHIQRVEAQKHEGR